MTDHIMTYEGKSGDGFGFRCPDCARSVLVTLNPMDKTVLFKGDESVTHAVKIGGVILYVGPIYRGAPVTDADKQFLDDIGIGWLCQVIPTRFRPIGL